MKIFVKYLFGFFLILFPFTTLTGEVFLDPPSLEFASEDLSNNSFTANILIENRDDRSLSISFITGGEAWSVDPSKLDIPPGGSSSIRVSGLLSEEEPGTVLFLSDRDDVPYLYFIRRKDSIASLVRDGGVEGEGHSLFFYTPGCLICEKFYNDLIPELVETYHLSPVPEKRNIYDSGNFELMQNLLSEGNFRGNQFPVLFVEGHVFRGESALFQDFPAFLADHDSFLPSKGKDALASPVPHVLSELHWLPVFMAGLLDGINPCAFTTLIFLISYLRLMGRKGKDILKIGGSFSLGVFMTYFMIGLGFFQAVRLAESFFLISQLIRWGMVVLLLGFSGLSFYDYVKVRQGNGGDFLLQLSKKTKKRIHRTVRNSSQSSWLILSSFGAGVLISLYELGCTGQIYLPMVVYMVKQDANWFTLFPLVLYNIGFILPLVLVFILFYRGSDSVQIAQVFEQHLGAVKLTTACLFFVIAGMLVLLG